MKKHVKIHGRRTWATLLSLALASAVGGLASASASENTLQSQLAIRDTAAAFIAQGIAREFPSHQIEVRELDPRLALPACDVPLEGFLPPGGRLLGNITVGIRCTGGKPWTVYVPATVKGMRKVVVATHMLLRGAPIAPNDIALEEREISSHTEAYISDPASVLGKIIKRPLTSAAILTPDMLAAPLLVRRGQRVTILAAGGGIEVKMTGTALMDGTEGQVIRAQAATSKRTVEGQVVQPGVIRVNM